MQSYQFLSLEPFRDNGYSRGNASKNMPAERSVCSSSTPVRPVDSSSAKSIDNIVCDAEVNISRVVEASVKGLPVGSYAGCEKCVNNVCILNFIKTQFLLITNFVLINSK